MHGHTVAVNSLRAASGAVAKPAVTVAGGAGSAPGLPLFALNFGSARARAQAEARACSGGITWRRIAGRRLRESGLFDGEQRRCVCARSGGRGAATHEGDGDVLGRDGRAEEGGGCVRLGGAVVAAAERWQRGHGELSSRKGRRGGAQRKGGVSPRDLDDDVRDSQHGSAATLAVGESLQAPSPASEGTSARASCSSRHCPQTRQQRLRREQ